MQDTDVNLAKSRKRCSFFVPIILHFALFSCTITKVSLMETLSFLKDGYKNTSSNGAKQVVISMNQNTVQTIRDAELAA